MRHDRYLYAIEWFFRVTSWIAAFAVVSLVICILTLLLAAPELVLSSLTTALQAEGIATADLAPSQLAVFLSVVAIATAIDYVLFRCIWKLFRVLRIEGQLNDGILSRLTVMARLFLASFFSELLAKTVMAIMVGGNTVLTHVIKREAMHPNWFGFLYPDFNGITALWMFLLCTFFVRLLRQHLDLQANVERLEEEQQLTV